MRHKFTGATSQTASHACTHDLFCGCRICIVTSDPIVTVEFPCVEVVAELAHANGSLTSCAQLVGTRSVTASVVDSLGTFGRHCVEVEVTPCL